MRIPRYLLVFALPFRKFNGKFANLNKQIGEVNCAFWKIGFGNPLLNKHLRTWCEGFSEGGFAPMMKLLNSLIINDPGAQGGSNPLVAFIYFHLFALDVAYQRLAADRFFQEMQIDATKCSESSK